MPRIATSETSDVELVDAFMAGVESYWSGEVPDGWEEPDAWHDPRVAGWLLASHAELGLHHFNDDEQS